MKIFGLLGYPLTHSASPAIFAQKFSMLGITDCRFELFPLSSIDLFPSLIASSPDIKGLAVTIPYKETVMGYLDQLDATAEAVGAVNCITFKNKILTGYNTDVDGFRQSLMPILKSTHTHALILGDGGASKAVAYVLDQLGIRYKKVVRKRGPKVDALLYDELTEKMVADHPLIINCTPLGMGNLAEELPEIPYSAITDAHLLYDLVYQSEVTPFLNQGMIREAQVKNGYEMLALQAERNWELWNA